MKRTKTISIIALAVIPSVTLFADTLERNLAKGFPVLHSSRMGLTFIITCQVIAFTASIRI